MVRRITALVVLGLVLLTATAAAQYGRTRQAPSHSSGILEHKVELFAIGGYSWTTAYDVYYRGYSGRFDIKDSGFWGVGLDVIMHSQAQLELLYTRQDSRLDVRGAWPPEDDDLPDDVAVEYYQIGGLGGMPRDNIFPFGSFTLGATRYVPKGSRYGDQWKFSIIPGLGAKFYLHERFGLRVQGRLPITFVTAGGGLWCGGYGCSASVGGSGLLQIDVSAGFMILL